MGFIFSKKRRKEERIMFKDKRTAIVGTMVMVLSLPLLTLTIPGKALAVYQCNIEVTGEKQGRIVGGSVEKGREGTFEGLTWSFGETLQTSTTTTGGYTTNLVIQDFKFTTKTSKGTTQLIQAAFTRERFKNAKAKIYRVDKAGKWEHFFTFTLENVIISSILHLGNSKSTEDLPVEEVVLKLIKGSKIKFTWEPDGKEWEFQIP
jgi:type VI secretion system Hcp family effector